MCPDEAARQKLEIDEGAIASRVQQLSEQRLSSKYAKQKTSLEKEFGNYLLNLHSPKTLMSAVPGDVISFLIWKDRNGRTQVHQPTCRASRSQRGAAECQCPKRLTFGTVDALIGKLRSIFCNIGRGSEWHSLLGVGNPAACRLVRNYLTDVREEQLKARVVPRQAEPVLLADLEVICFLYSRGTFEEWPTFGFAGVCACQRSSDLQGVILCGRPRVGLVSVKD